MTLQPEKTGGKQRQGGEQLSLRLDGGGEAPGQEARGSSLCHLQSELIAQSWDQDFALVRSGVKISDLGFLLWSV